MSQLSMADGLRCGQLKKSRRPSFIDAAHFALDPEGFFAGQLSKHGDPFVLEMPGIGKVLVSGSKDAAKELFAASVDTFAPLPLNPVEPLLGTHSLLILSGERHRRERKLMAAPFSKDRMRAYGELICERARLEFGRLSGQQEFILQQAMRNISLDIILGAVLGVRHESRASEFRSTIATMLDSYTSPLLVMPPLRRPLFGLSPWVKFARARDQVCALLRAEIGHRRKNHQNMTDILSLLIQARYDDGSSLSDDELIDESRTLIVGGHDTTTTAMTWAFYYLYKNPEHLARLQQELALFGSSPSPAILNDLPFLGAICHEALRIHPVVPIVPRMALQPISYCGYDIAPGEYVALSISLLHRQPDTWPEPSQFIPDRFVNKKYTPFEYAPFGGGTRRCIGAAFGTYQMRMVLGTIAASTNLQLLTTIDPHRILSGITMGPKHPIRMALRGT